jgi:hypothetical protein
MKAMPAMISLPTIFNTNFMEVSVAVNKNLQIL